MWEKSHRKVQRTTCPCPHRLPPQPGPDPWAKRRHNQEINSFASVYDAQQYQNTGGTRSQLCKVLLEQGLEPCARGDEATNWHKSFKWRKTGDFPGDPHLLTAQASL